LTCRRTLPTIRAPLDEGIDGFVALAHAR
jgi:hypothetical protein